MNNLQLKTTNFLSSINVKSYVEQILGNKTNQFISSLVSAVNSTPALAECEARSILSAALTAASYDLPIDSNLGFAAIVPYKSYKDKTTNAQFQMMYKGFIQLAIRSGQYKKMHVTEVYEDEVLNYNPIFMELELTKDFTKTEQRRKGMIEKIAGYYAYFELSNGFRKELFMTPDDCINHAKTYSKSYSYDLKENKKSSKWTTDFDMMCKKTVIKLLLSKWGLLSVDMQNAIKDDQKIFEKEDGEYKDNTPAKDEMPEIPEIFKQSTENEYNEGDE